MVVLFCYLLVFIEEEVTMICPHPKQEMSWLQLGVRFYFFAKIFPPLCKII